MRKVNLLCVITKLELGGAQTQLLSLLKNIDQNRFNLFLFTAQNGLLNDEVSRCTGLTFYRSDYLDRPINPLKDALALVEIFRFIKKYKIDIVHTHSSKAGIVGRWAAALAGVKLIIHTVHGWSFNDFQPSLARRIFIGLERFNATFTDKIIVVSDHDKKKGLSHRIGRELQYCLIHYGVDEPLFKTKDPAIRGELGIAAGDLVVGTVSCFKPQKALEDFLELAFLICQTLPRTKFLVVGDGALRKKIEKRISDHGLQTNVVLTGWRRDIPRVLSAMDVFVLTSLWEGMPIAAIEAMAAGLPVFATHTGGVSEIVKDGKTGGLVPCQDMTFMLQKIIPLLENEALRKQVGQNARESVSDRFKVEDMIKKTEYLYARSLEEDPRTHAH